MSTDEGTIESQRRADFVRNFDRIIEGATLALASNPAASMREIAEHSGVVRATLYRHYDNRDELLRAIYRSGLESAGQAIQAAEPDRNAAPAALRRVIEELAAVAGRYRIITEQQLNYPDLLPEAEAAFAPMIELVERGQKEGSLRRDLSASWVTTAIAALITTSIGSVARGDLDAADCSKAVAITILEPIEACGSETK